jgi:hypothetical protein
MEYIPDGCTWSSDRQHLSQTEMRYIYSMKYYGINRQRGEVTFVWDKTENILARSDAHFLYVCWIHISCKTDPSRISRRLLIVEASTTTVSIAQADARGITPCL